MISLKHSRMIITWNCSNILKCNRTLWNKFQFRYENCFGLHEYIEWFIKIVEWIIWKWIFETSIFLFVRNISLWKWLQIFNTSVCTENESSSYFRNTAPSWPQGVGVKGKIEMEKLKEIWSLESERFSTIAFHILRIQVFTFIWIVLYILRNSFNSKARIPENTYMRKMCFIRTHFDMKVDTGCSLVS